MISVPRYLSRAESPDATISVTFPRFRGEYEQEQPLIRSSSPLTGQDYSFDQMGEARSLKANGIERVRFLLVDQSATGIDAAIDELKALASLGRVKIFTTGAGDEHEGDGARWAWARLEMMPTLSLGVRDRQSAPVSLSFDRFSDWFSVDPIGPLGEFEIAADPETVEVANPGNAPIYNAIVTVKGAFAGLSISNETALVPGTESPYVLETDSLGAGAADWIRFDAGRNVVEISSDSGATWADDSGNFVRADGQVRLIVFAPGANELTIAGAAGCEIVVEMYGAWH